MYWQSKACSLFLWYACQNSNLMDPLFCSIIKSCLSCVSRGIMSCSKLAWIRRNRATFFVNGYRLDLLIVLRHDAKHEAEQSEHLKKYLFGQVRTELVHHLVHLPQSRRLLFFGISFVHIYVKLYVNNNSIIFGISFISITVNANVNNNSIIFRISFVHIYYSKCKC